MNKAIKKAQDRFASKRFGVFNHYIKTNEITDWNDAINSFDTQRLAKNLHEMGAGYYFITLIHGTPYMISKNPTYEKFCGELSHIYCARRDLIGDLYDSLSEYGIDLCIYCNAYAPLFRKIPKEIRESFSPHCRDFCRADPETDGMPYIPTLDFAKSWASCIEDISARYGNKIKAWWFDSCYEHVGYKFETIKPLYEAVKKGNPIALTAFNNGVMDKICKWYPDEEMTCGEFNEFTHVPDSQFTDGAQNHILIPLGYNSETDPAGWYQKNSKVTHRELAEYVKKLEQVRCPLSIDIFVHPDGSFEESQVEIIRGI